MHSAVRPAIMPSDSHRNSSRWHPARSRSLRPEEFVDLVLQPLLARLNHRVVMAVRDAPKGRFDFRAMPGTKGQSGHDTHPWIVSWVAIGAGQSVTGLDANVDDAGIWMNICNQA